MMMDARVFCDTNVVIRLNVLETPEHHQVKMAFEMLLNNQSELWISRQVIREFCAVLTRPQTFAKPLPAPDVASRAKAIMRLFNVADEDELVTDQLFVLMSSIPVGGKQVHDVNIVATMRVYNIKRIFTLNPVDFNRFSSMVEVITLADILK